MSDGPRGWQERQREHLFFTWTHQAGVQGLEITDAKGPRFEVAGQGWFWDLESQVYNVNVGHRHAHVQRRMIEQIQTLPACAPNVMLPIRAELATMLAERTGLHRAFLTTGGSEAVENAVKIARLVTGRSKVVTRRQSYHGATLAVLGIAGDLRKQPYASDLAPAYHIEDGADSDWLDSFERLLAQEGANTVAAVLLEGFTGTNGMQHPPEAFWPGVRALCDRHGILLIDDEIFSGFGRTGKWFARERWEVSVDIMTLGKGLTSGYAPLAAVMVSEEISDRFAEEKLWCGLTHYAHPVSCAAAVGAIEVTVAEGLVDNSERMGRLFAEGFDQLVGRHERLRSHRGYGLMRCLELDRDGSSLVKILWNLGAYAPFRANTLFLCPPLCLRETEVRAILDLLDEGLSQWI